jgi:caffeoyl-CoA O-methyltransferase
MSRILISVTDALKDYIATQGVSEAPALARLREATQGMRGAGMQISPLQGQFMALLVRAIGARRCLEIGTYTGYSALAVALALPADGRLIACDINAEWTAMAPRHWRDAGVADKVQLRLGPALDSLDALVAERQAGAFDFAFIDADKTNYDAYYERCLTLLRPGGLIAIDNVLWGGRVADPKADDEDTRAIRALNAKIHGDARVHATIVPIGDGVMLAFKHGHSR